MSIKPKRGIQAAAAREPRPMSRLSLAFDLAQLGDQSGVDLLTQACSDASRPAVERLFAAQETRSLHRDACLSDVLSILESNIDAPEAIQALNFFSGFDDLPGSNGVERQAAIVGAATRRLGDDDAGVRIAASNVLSRIGDSSAAEALRQAILRETVEAAKSEMQRDLETLEKKNR